MIPKHAEFLIAIQEKKKVWIKFYSKADSGVLEHTCAPMDYGPGEMTDGLNRYWLWDFASDTCNRTLGLVPQQIVDMTVLGEDFDPELFFIGPSPMLIAPAMGRINAAHVASDDASGASLKISPKHVGEKPQIETKNIAAGQIAGERRNGIHLEVETRRETSARLHDEFPMTVAL